MFQLAAVDAPNLCHLYRIKLLLYANSKWNTVNVKKPNVQNPNYAKIQTQESLVLGQKPDPFDKKINL